ncbi:MAG: ribosomal protein S18-alanine N-acetyltransferase [Dorea sp.]
MIDVRKIREDEIEVLEQLEKRCFPDPWSFKSILETYQQNHAVILGGYRENKMVGYVIFYYVLDEGEIARIAVEPECRRTGAATGVFEALLKLCAEKEITKIMLDVRESNASAIAFYRKCGFTDDGIRKRFYSDPVEDALLMSMSTGR